NLTRVCFLDPSFTNGGDRTVAYFGTLGTSTEGVRTLEFDDYQIFHEDITDQTLTRSQQLIKWWRGLCESRGIGPRNCGFDSPATAPLRGDLLDVVWSKEVWRLNFCDTATDKPVSAFDATPCNE